MLPLEFWLLADRLIRNEPNAAGFRSAISRAYYAAFLTALNFLDEAGVVFPRTVKRGDLHRHVPDLLNNSGDPDVAAAGTMLGNLRDERNRADYDYQDVSVENDAYARTRYAEAGTILGELNTCRQTRGQSGGPLIGKCGRVVGVVSERTFEAVEAPEGPGFNVNAILPIVPAPVTGMQSWFDTVCEVRKV